MESSKCLARNILLSVLLENKQVRVLGMTIGCGIYGGLLVMGMICFRLLGVQRELEEPKAEATRRPWSPNLCTWLRWYNTTFTFLCVVVGSMIESCNSDKDGKRLLQSNSALNLLGVLILMMCDALSIWRCYKVQKMFVTKGQIIQNIFWILPLILWFAILVSVILANALEPKAFSSGGRLSFYVVCASCNVALNISATSYLTIRLMLHRRVVLRCLRDHLESVDSRKPHLRIVGILLESAGLNVPITAVSIAGVCQNRSYSIASLLLVPPAQSFASILVIYQVAIKKTISGSGEMQKEA